MKGALLFAALGLACAAAAPGARANDEFGNLGAAVVVTRYQTGFDIGQTAYDGKATEIGLALRQHFTDDFSMGMTAGYADMTLSGDPATANLSPSGYYGLLTAHYRVPFTAHLGLDFTAAGGYHRMSDARGADSVVERWWSYSAAAGPRFSLEYFGVEAGLVYRHASGREESSGNSGTRTFEFERTTNPYLDLTFAVSEGGTVTLHAEGGARRGVSLIFGYLFARP